MLICHEPPSLPPGLTNQDITTTNGLNQYQRRTIPRATDISGEKQTSAPPSPVNATPATRLDEYFHKELTNPKTAST